MNGLYASSKCFYPSLNFFIGDDNDKGIYCEQIGDLIKNHKELYRCNGKLYFAKNPNYLFWYGMNEFCFDLHGQRNYMNWNSMGQLWYVVSNKRVYYSKYQNLQFFFI